MKALDRDSLTRAGRALVVRFCRHNGWPLPKMPTPGPIPWARNRWQGCGLYSRGRIFVHPARCAAPGYRGRAWSWPGYIIDRTPFGVYAHELGHYAELMLRWPATTTYHASGERPLTSYAPNHSEWWAEMFRLFVTNPDLLRGVRPRTFRCLAKMCEPLPAPRWGLLLAGAPPRTVAMAQRRIKEAGRREANR